MSLLQIEVLSDRGYRRISSLPYLRLLVQTGWPWNAILFADQWASELQTEY